MGEITVGGGVAFVLKTASRFPKKEYISTNFYFPPPLHNALNHNSLHSAV